jgi:hypothetical protein
MAVVVPLMMPGTRAVAQAEADPAEAHGSHGSHGRLEVIPRDANVYGNSYGEWAARWWQWAAAIPKDTNPVLRDDSSPGGANCGEGQAGPVWFLGSTFFGGTFTRTCTVPGGKALFFPIVPAIWGAGVSDCEPTAPGVVCNLVTLRVVAAESMDEVQLSASLNGKQLRDLDDQRVQSPVLAITYPENAALGPPHPAGTYTPNVGDGYWLMLAPPPTGAHTISFAVDITGGPFAGIHAEVTYHLTVGP